MATNEELAQEVEELRALVAQALEVARRHAPEHADEGSDPFTGRSTAGHTHDKITDADLDTAWETEQSADEDKLRAKTGGTERLVLDNEAMELRTVPLLFEEISAPSVPAVNHSQLFTYAQGTQTALIWQTSSGDFKILALGGDTPTPHSNTLTLNLIE